ncbi:hypothetical protein RF11_08428 [Thelohanellus kitauei]|uniref:Reverse transcriptase n=1 Tax=Thelohanellus kitauei TaxID=669202 RepID=A0A0C2MPM1_THEKT|nr:hypothetical protein RF11_16407 [Thelohanellus kitauei]KII64963.1 hypothetical protein RF11_08428 [Thelohanellus kitauei]
MKWPKHPNIHINALVDTGASVNAIKISERFNIISGQIVWVEPDKIGLTDITEHKIITTSHHPIRVRPYRQPINKHREISDLIEKMVSSGIIRAVFVKKNDRTYRLCIDYRILNDITIKDTYSHPLIDDLLDRLKYSKYFSRLELRNRYWQCPVSKQYLEKTPFSPGPRRGQFEFDIVPFGLVNAPSNIQWMIYKIIGNCHFAAAYLDDIIVYSSDLPSYLVHLETIFTKLKNAGLKINPLYQNRLLSENTPWCWDDVANNAFRKLKQDMSNLSSLNFPNPVIIFKLSFDASDNAIGAVLTQNVGNIDMPIFYFNKKCLAIVSAVKKFKQYLLGCRFTIVTDYKPPFYLKSIKDPSGARARWILELENFDYEIVHFSGVNNVIADGLCRSIGGLSFISIIILICEQENRPRNIKNTKFSRIHSFYLTHGLTPLIPKHLRQEYFDRAHSGWSGHIGVKKILALINGVAFLNKASFWSVDFTAPLPTTKQGNKYIIVFCNQVTRWVEAKAVPDQKVTTATDAMIEFTKGAISNVKYLNVCVKSKDLKNLVHRQLTPAAMAPTNERTLPLRKNCDTSATPNPATKFTPAEMIYSEKIRTPVDLEFHPGGNPQNYVIRPLTPMFRKLKRKFDKYSIPLTKILSKERDKINWNKFLSDLKNYQCQPSCIRNRNNYFPVRETQEAS